MNKPAAHLGTPAAEQATATQVVRVAVSKKSKRSNKAVVVRGLCGLLGALLIWEIASQASLVNSKFLPPPSLVLPQLVTMFGGIELWVAIWETIKACAIGLLIAAIAGSGLGILVALSPFLTKFTRSTVEFLRPIPSVALIPVAVLLFGNQIESSILLIVYACFWQFFVQALYGVADVDKVAMSTGRSFQFSRWQLLRDIALPTALPYLMTGLRLGAAFALVIAVSAQLIIGTPGLGQLLANAQYASNYVMMYAVVLVTGLLGVVINLLVRALERRTLSWHQSVRGDVN